MFGFYRLNYGFTNFHMQSRCNKNTPDAKGPIGPKRMECGRAVAGGGWRAAGGWRQAAGGTVTAAAAVENTRTYIETTIWVKNIYKTYC